MTEATPMLPQWGIPDHDLQQLIARGRRRGVLTMEEVVDVLRTVELTAEVIESVRASLLAADIELDESIPPIDLGDLDDELPAVPHTGPTSVPPPSVEAELHEAKQAASYIAGDFEEDGP